MAQLARLQWVVQSTVTGKPVVGAFVEVRSQGATVNGVHAGQQTSFTVNDPGAIVAGNTVAINAASSPTRSVSSVAATNVTVGGLGFLDVQDDDRISLLIPLPTIYNDAQLAETISNPLTTDANGLAQCWLKGGRYDLLVSQGASVTPIDRTLYQDVPVFGETNISSQFGGGGAATAWKFDTLRTLDGGDALVTFAEAGSSRFQIFRTGNFTAGSGTSTIPGSLTVNGLITGNAGATVTGAISASTTVSAGTTVTAGTGLIATSGGLNSTGTSTFNSSSVTGITTLTRQRAAESSLGTLSTATPSVATGTVFNENYGGATTITNFTSGATGQIIHIICFTGNMTIQDNANIKLAGSANFVGTSEDTITLVFDGTTWYEVCRSVN